MIELPKEVVEALQTRGTFKVLTTTDENGVPHTVFKESLSVLPDGNLAYIELIERSRTYKNMLRNLWFKKKVAISIFNPKKNIAYQIKGIPYRCIIEGPIWEEFRAKMWDEMPDLEPAALWLITPDEVLNESSTARVEEEKKRILQYEFWNVYQRRRATKA